MLSQTNINLLLNFKNLFSVQDFIIMIVIIVCGGGEERLHVVGLAKLWP